MNICKYNMDKACLHVSIYIAVKEQQAKNHIDQSTNTGKAHMHPVTMPVGAGFSIWIDTGKPYTCGFPHHFDA
jgi:hypothetical protein